MLTNNAAWAISTSVASIMLVRTDPTDLAFIFVCSVCMFVRTWKCMLLVSDGGVCLCMCTQNALGETQDELQEVYS